MPVINSPETYLEMAKPFESVEEANAAIEGFFADLYEIRKKHKICNVHVSLLDSVKIEGRDKPETIFTTMHIGNSEHEVLMTTAARVAASERRSNHITDFAEHVRAGVREEKK